MSDPLPDDIPSLKAHAAELLKGIREKVLSGNFELKPEIQQAVANDSAAERADLASKPDFVIDQMLRTKGLNRQARRTYISNLRRKPRQTPGHVEKAQRIANRRALERASSQ